MKKQRIGIQEFIEKVKAELLATRMANKGKEGYFQLDEVELEIVVGYSVEGKGNVKFWVVELESGADYSKTHTVKLKFSILDETPPNVTNSELDSEETKKIEFHINEEIGAIEPIFDKMIENRTANYKKRVVTVGGKVYFNPYELPPNQSKDLRQVLTQAMGGGYVIYEDIRGEFHQFKLPNK